MPSNNDGTNFDDNFLLDDVNTNKLRDLISSDSDNNNEGVLFSDDDMFDDDYIDDENPRSSKQQLSKYKGKKIEDHLKELDSHGSGEDEDYEYSGEDGEEEDYNDNNGYEEPSPIDFGFSSEEDEAFNEEDIDEDFEFRNALREATNFKVKPKKGDKKKKKGGLAALRRKIRRTELPPEVKQLLSKANEAFVRNDLQIALNLYLQVVKLDKNNFSAYKTLGEIYRLQGNFNKCSNFWLLAAHIHPWDYEFWRTLAELSVELGHKRQAMYCYTKAVSSSNHTDYDSIFARACLYRERGQFKRAADSLQKLKAILPTEPKIFRELAKVYVDENRVNDAITMYTKVLEENVKFRKLGSKGERADFTTIKFDWSELNILLELYCKKSAWILGIKTLRQLSRWIQGRENQIFWDESFMADAEFDDRRFESNKFKGLSNEEKLKEYQLPIDIRVQLGSFRLNSKNTKEALIHFEKVLDENIEETADLYLKIGTELETFGLYAEALKYLYPLSYLEENNTPELVLSIAKCLRETEEFELAKEAYIRLLEYEPSNVEVKVALAEVCFYLGEMETTAQLYKEAKQQRSRERDSARSNLLMDTEGSFSDEAENDIDDDNNDALSLLSREQQSLIAEYPVSKKNKRKKPQIVSIEELHLKEMKSTTRMREQYQRSVRLLERLENDMQLSSKDKSSIASMWIDLVSELIETFSTYRCFFSSDRAKKFNSGLRRRTAKLSIDQKLSRIPYLQDEMILSKEMDSGKMPVPDEIFKGIIFEDWYDLFMKYSLMIAEYEGNVEDAIQIQEIAKHVNVFKHKELSTTLVGLSVGLKTGDPAVIMNQVRFLMNDFQFSLPALKAFIASCSPSQNFYPIYADAPNQKYMLRQVKAHDSLRANGKEITGMAAITNTIVDKSKDHPLLSYIYSSLLYMNRSFNPALTYLNRIYKDYSKDPSILFLMALSHLHRSMQRKSINRHFQIIQGLTLMLEYMETKDPNNEYDLIEINYNFGRTFNLLGLNTLAVNFYEKVLQIEVEDKKYDLRLDAAYNLCLVYSHSGNLKLADDIMTKYLTI